MAYQEFFLRGPSVDAIKRDIKSVLSGHGIDPFAVGVLEQHPDGGEVFGPGFDPIPAGTWYESRPTPKKEGTKGTYALLNVVSRDQTLLSIIEQFESSPASKEPSEVPDSEKIGEGTHQIDPPNTPWAAFL
jgi:hypothetical protein